MSENSSTSEIENPLTQKEVNDEAKHEEKTQETQDKLLEGYFESIKHDMLTRLHLMSHLGADDKFRSIFQFYGIDNPLSLKCILDETSGSKEINFIKMLKQLKKHANDVKSYEDYVFINNALASGVYLNFLNYEKQRNGNVRYFALKLSEAPVIISAEEQSKTWKKLAKDRFRK